VNPNQTKFYSARICLRFLPYSFKRWKALLAIVAIMLSGIVLNALKPWPMKILIDNVLYQKPMSPALANAVAILPGTTTRENVIGWIVSATVIIFFFQWMLRLANSYASIGFGQRMVYDLAADVFEHLQRLSLGFHNRSPIGDSIKRVTSDCGCVSIIIKDALLPATASLVSLVIMLAIMWRMDPGLTLLSISVVPLMLLVILRYTGPVIERSYEQQQAEARMYNVIEQTLSSIPVVKAFGYEEQANIKFQASTDAILETTLSATSIQLQFKVLAGLATAIGTAAIIWIGSQHVLSGQITVGSILVFLSYLGSLYGPLQSLAYTPSTIQGAAGSARRVIEVLEAEPEVKDRPGAHPLPPVKGFIRLEAVTFGYERNRAVLEDISLEVQPGNTIAIVGVTGAGKTTLVSLIPRFFDPWKGRVTIDGHDLRDVQLKSLRQQVGIVLQESFLFPITIAENIAYGRPDASPEQIEQAARAANAHKFIELLPAGYDTVIGERGGTLSGGERQRLAIARALLKDAPILILDEPTSALDSETEGEVLQALGRLMSGRTTLIIAHRLSTTHMANRIFVLKDGMIAEAGTHEELLARNALYARLYKTQFGNTA
jgi:ATP-binding cassette, subfamily B, bacterial